MNVKELGDIYYALYFLCVTDFYLVKNPEEIKAFGVHLRRLREARNLSQQKLADIADVAKRTIQRIENGQSCATNDLMISIARAMSVEPLELMSFPTVVKKKK